MSRLDAKIAERYLRSRRSSRLVSLITLIATGGVTVGVMALIVVMGVMNGMQNDLREKILIATPHLRILTYGQGLLLEDWESVRDQVKTHPDVIAVSPFVLSQGLLSAGFDYSEGANILGVDLDTNDTAVTQLAGRLRSGNLSFETDLDGVDGGIILGRRLGQRLSAYPGDKLSVISPIGSKFNAALGVYVPKYWTFEVTGHFETGMFEYDNAYALLPRKLGQKFAGLGDAVTGLDVRLSDPRDAPRVAAELEGKLDYPYRAIDWQSQNEALFSALQLEKLAMGTILLLIVIVAAFNIISTLTMLVRDKTREIGILRAMGLPARTVRRIFILQGTFIGVVGTAIGTSLGLILAQVIDKRQIIDLNPSVYFIDHLPVQVDPRDLVVIVLASIVVATAATIYPAQQAASLHPVDAIKYE
ncbi:MAG: FtsX-like permease family protein [Gemmatimonadales bacterium]